MCMSEVSAKRCFMFCEVECIGLVEWIGLLGSNALPIISVQLKDRWPSYSEGHVLLFARTLDLFARLHYL
jgi:hypothetical protein